MKLYHATKTEPHFGRPGRRPHYFTPTQKSKVYDAILASGNDGTTRADISAKTGVAKDRVSFYLSDLRRAGYIAVKGDPTVVSPNMNADEAAFAAMLGLENALIARVRESGATNEMDRAFVRYNKIKELALRPGTGPEGRSALRMAVVELVKLVF